MSARTSVASNELLRRAYKYIARNTTLPSRVRMQAQLQLNQFPAKSRPAAVRNRCVETGRGRAVINEFGLCRVSAKRPSGCHIFRNYSMAFGDGSTLTSACFLPFPFASH